MSIAVKKAEPVLRFDALDIFTGAGIDSNPFAFLNKRRNV